jgi:DNA repair protein RadC
VSIKDWPPEERPREKLLAFGPGRLSDAELVAIFVRRGRAGRTAVDVAREALGRAGSLRSLLDMDEHAMRRIEGFGPATHAELKACLELGKRYLEARAARGDPLRNPADT